jgi:hypothetical protein
MPHYVVNIRSPDQYVEAIEYDDYTNLQAAAAFAVFAIKELLGEMFDLGMPLRSSQLDVVDDEGNVKLTVPIGSLMH